MNECLGKRKNSKKNLSSLTADACLRNQRGQFAIEAVLLMALLIGCFTYVTGVVKDKKMIPRLFSGPVKSMRNMTGFGTFRESCEGLGSNKKKQNLSQCHPNSISRALSSDPSKL